MNKDENLKVLVDRFGQLSFLMETAVKLYQTGDSPEIRDLCFSHAFRVSEMLTMGLDVFIAETIGHE